MTNEIISKSINKALEMHEKVLVWLETLTDEQKAMNFWEADELMADELTLEGEEKENIWGDDGSIGDEFVVLQALLEDLDGDVGEDETVESYAKGYWTGIIELMKDEDFMKDYGFK